MILSDSNFVIHEPSSSEPFVVLNKPPFLPSAPLKTNDDSALTRAISLFPSLKNVIGKKEIEYGLIHRIDNDTKGLILIASTQEFYNFMQEEQKNGRFKKWYKATVEYIKEAPKLLEGFPNCPFSSLIFQKKEIVVESYFRHYGLHNSQVRPVTNESGRAAIKKCGNKLYSTTISVVDNKAVCSLNAGFKHQVRCHLAWCGFPIIEDKIYNPKVILNNKNDDLFDFTAFKLSFSGFEIEI